MPCLSEIKLTAAQPAAEKDAGFLLKAAHTAGESKALFYYSIPSGPKDSIYDNSASPMAALGLSVMVPAGFEIPQEFWQLTEQAWQRHQCSDGAWFYIPQTPSPHSASMTAAGVATLLITQALLVDSSGCRGNAVDPHIDKGIAWLGANFDATFDVNRQLNRSHLESYALFAISRGGGKRKSLFRSGRLVSARGYYLLATRRPDGTWPVSSIPGVTAMDLLFLAYGSSPVIFDKLQYTTLDRRDTPRASSGISALRICSTSSTGWAIGWKRASTGKW